MPKIPWKTGAYQIRNLVNGKVYVGGAYKSFDLRKQGHYKSLRKGWHFNKHLQNAWNKYGERAFVFEILERCPSSEVVNCEQRWLDKLTPYDNKIGYNRSHSALGTLGITMPEEAKAKIARAAKKQWEDEAHRLNVSEKNRAAALKQMENPKAREISRQAGIKQWATEEGRAKQLSVLRDDKTIAKIREATVKLWTREGHREDVSAKIAATVNRKYASGELIPAKGNQLPQAKLTEKKVRQIRMEFARVGKRRGIFADLSRRFKVGASSIKAVIFGRSWKHIK